MEGPMDMEAISRNVFSIRARIADACRRADRSPDEITLIAVSKTFPMAAVEAAIRAGVCHFGENRVQELVQSAQKPRGAGREGTGHGT